ncbi:hypothetical protein CLOM_g16952 [Closterium sp. NIES-68]|nr:hypothetical protein CLOM_g16952 [Closterium sp. NIES-68]GJP85329.1 hypothetical protein CLOP_g15436 [Closterium sp. NIES-67]
MSIFSKIKAVDFYRRIPRDLTEASLSGATLSLVAAIWIVVLVWLELRAFLTVTTSTTVIVDQSPNTDLLRINFNFSFPALSCEFASVDITDVIGTARYNLSRTLRKHPIDAALRIVGPQHHPDPIPELQRGGNEGGEEEEAQRQLAEEGIASGGEAGEKQYVGSLVLDSRTFDAATKQYPILIVNFFAPWCHWCQLLEPAWEQAATVMSQKYHPDHDGRIRLAKVDCTMDANLCFSHHVQGYPSIRVFRKGDDSIMREHGQHDHESYYGERDTLSLIAFSESLVAAAQAAAAAAGGGAALPGADPAAAAASDPNRRRAPQAAGCQIEGFVLVKKVPGNLMVHANSPSHSFDAAAMNLSHVVHHLSFGRQLPARKRQHVERLMPLLHLKDGRLNNHTFTSQHERVTHEHFLQLVLTEVRRPSFLSSATLPATTSSTSREWNRHALHAFDFTVHSHTLQRPDELPAARFHYLLSPMQVVLTETRASLAGFLTNLCAIIGGVFTVAGIVDGMLHGAVRVAKKIQLGKNS